MLPLLQIKGFRRHQELYKQEAKKASFMVFRGMGEWANFQDPASEH